MLILVSVAKLFDYSIKVLNVLLEYIDILEAF